MDKEQEARFEAWMHDYTQGEDYTNTGWHGDMQNAWQAALDSNPPAIPDGYYRIGDEVEYQPQLCDYELKARVVLLDDHGTIFRDNDRIVRRIPAWTPKEGEAVLVKMSNGKTSAAVASGPDTIYDNGSPNGKPYGMKPFDASKIGKPWEEV